MVPHLVNECLFGTEAQRVYGIVIDMRNEIVTIHGVPSTLHAGSEEIPTDWVEIVGIPVSDVDSSDESRNEEGWKVGRMNAR